ncbi:hypothetical protein OICFNHDK_3267 [Methylobacterium bullatum]|uniref:N-acetyltransferase domain-containing protein n=2 Tax=Methylobacterium bullatum TaxID=570505 RepID=A0AAV4ZA12_9HYPH|nr:hypothetical protein OICFNHDK_3267 [Methylobacterium bullatum]
MRDINRSAELIERDAWIDWFAAAPDGVRDELGLTSTTIAGMGLLGCRAIPIIELNRAIAVGIQKSPSMTDLDAAASWLDRHTVSWAMQIAPGARTPALSDFIARAALSEAGSGWAKFVAQDAPRSRDPILEPVTVEIIDDERADEFGRAVIEGFGLPEVCQGWFAALADRPLWQCFAAIVDGEIASCGAMFVRDEVAWFGMQATRPAFRCRGFQRSIIAAQMSAAAEMGATVFTCETSHPINRADKGFTSYRNQERAGLTFSYARPNFKRTA